MKKLPLLIKPVASHGEGEGHRQSSWLELFVDVGFVMAIGATPSLFEDGLSSSSLLTYVSSFLIIFWIWDRITWYATFYDNGDVPFRLSLIATVFCVLGIASSVDGVPAGNFIQFTFYYLLIEMILLYLWGRVWRRSVSSKDKTLAKYLLSSHMIGTLLIAFSLFIGNEMLLLCWASAILIEAIGPIMAWQKLDSEIAVNTNHIVERHGLFTIILLGEGILAISSSMIFPASIENVLPLATCYGIVALLWWIYFDYGFGFSTNLSNSLIRVFVFGYGQFFVFLSLSLIAVSIELGLHTLLATDTVYSDSHSIARLLLWSVSTFITTISAVQIAISTINPKKAYLPRLAGGTFIGSLAIFAKNISFMSAANIILIVLLVIVVNEIYQWGTLAQKGKK